MTMLQRGREAFNKRHRYRSVLSSDNIDLKHCGNCANLNRFTGDCSLMAGYGVQPEERKADRRRGLCDLWQRGSND